MKFVIQREGDGMFLKAYSVKCVAWTQDRGLALPMPFGRAKALAVCALSCKVKILEA